MAKKQKTQVDPTPQVVEQPKQKKVETKKPSWEIKDRTYILKGMSPLTFMLKSKNIYYSIKSIHWPNYSIRSNRKWKK